TSAGLRSCSASASPAARLTTLHSWPSSVGQPTPVSTRIAPARGSLITNPCTGISLNASSRARWRRTISTASRKERGDAEDGEEQGQVDHRIGPQPPRPSLALEVEQRDSDQSQPKHDRPRQVDGAGRAGAPAQPTGGGMAPAAAPMTMFWGVERFSQIV